MASHIVEEHLRKSPKTTYNAFETNKQTNRQTRLSNRKWFNHKDETAKHKLSSMVQAVQSSITEKLNNLFYRRGAQHRRASSSVQHSAVHLYFINIGHAFKDSKVHIIAKEATSLIGCVLYVTSTER